MRRVVVPCMLAGVIALATGGCATTRPILFIATPGYVEARIAASEQAVRSEYEALLADQRTRIEALEADLNAYRSVADELLALARAIREVESSNAELRQLAAAIETRLAGLPVETVRLIIRALQEELGPGAP